MTELREIRDGWLVPALQADEAKRLAALYELQILDSEAEKAFDNITKLVARYLDVPIVLISLIESDRQWFKSCYGLDQSENPRDQSFCVHAVLEPEVMIVPDATKDRRFRTNTLVTGEPYIRFYAGAPLITKQGYRLGSLCAIDREPRPDLTEDQRMLLRTMADIVMDEMELRLSNARVQEANRVKSDFLANMSHEIRTPLNGVIATASLLQETDLAEEQASMVTTIIKSGDMLLEIINEILDFSKIEAGKLSLNNQRFNLEDVVREAFTLFEPRAREKGLDYTVEISPDLPDSLNGDALRIRQITLNFISNALKFTEHGAVHIGLQGAYTDEGFYAFEIHVRDTGPGISEKHKKGIFEKFEQVQAHTNISSGGSGLGLAISKSLAEMMGGNVGFESLEGAGSTFWFRATLPASTSVAKVKRERDAKPAVPQDFKARVLVAEDVETNRMVIQKMLNSFACQYDLAHNGAEAVKLAAENAYDLILMDMRMPEMDGFAATKAIRAQSDGKCASVPIVALTAYAVEQFEQECLSAGMNDFLTKPLKKESLGSMLSKWLNR